jgi:cell division protein FtsB
MRKWFFDSVVMILCLLLYGYFGWHYFYGPRSAAVLVRIETEQARLLGQMESEIAKRRQLEARVELLRPEHIDLDFLDEMARRTLSYVGQNELIISK